MMAWLQNPESWVFIGFVIFVVLAFKKAKAAITGGLDARAEKIRTQIAEAEKLRAEAEAMLRDAEQRHKTALQEAKAMLAAAEREAGHIKEQAAKDLAQILARRKQAAVEKIAQAEAAALAEVRQVAIDVAIAATRQVLTSQVQGALADRMIDQAITELPRRLS